MKKGRYSLFPWFTAYHMQSGLALTHTVFLFLWLELKVKCCDEKSPFLREKQGWLNIQYTKKGLNVKKYIFTFNKNAQIKGWNWGEDEGKTLDLAQKYMIWCWQKAERALTRVMIPHRILERQKTHTKLCQRVQTETTCCAVTHGLTWALRCECRQSVFAMYAIQTANGHFAF